MPAPVPEGTARAVDATAQLTGCAKRARSAAVERQNYFRLGTVDDLVVPGLLYTDLLEIAPVPCTIVMGVAR